MLINNNVLDKIFQSTNFGINEKLSFEAVNWQFEGCSDSLWRDFTDLIVQITEREAHCLKVNINGLDVSIENAPKALGSILSRIKNHKLRSLHIDYYSTERPHETDIRRIEPIFREFLKQEYGDKLTKLRSIACEGFFYNQPEIPQIILRNRTTLRRLVINPGHNDLHKAVEQCDALRSLTIYQTTWLTLFEQKLGSILKGKALAKLAIAASKHSPIPRFVENYVVRALADLKSPVKSLRLRCQLGNFHTPLPSSFRPNDRFELAIFSGLKTLELCQRFSVDIFNFCPLLSTLILNFHDEAQQPAYFSILTIDGFFQFGNRNLEIRYGELHKLRVKLRLPGSDLRPLLDKLQKQFPNHILEEPDGRIVTFFSGNAQVVLEIESFTKGTKGCDYLCCSHFRCQ